MGLDMFLYRREKHSNDRTEFAYWRKANAILNWFDHNLDTVKRQEFDYDGKDKGEEYKEGRFTREGVKNCAYYKVTKDEYHKLIDDCKQVLTLKEKPDKIPDDLKPCEGFFFGGKEVDEWYWGDIQDTIDMLTEKEPDWENDILEFFIWY